MKVSFRIGGRPSAELASKNARRSLEKQSAARQMGAGQCLCRVRIRDRSRSDRLLHFQLNAAMKRYRYLLNQWNGLDKVSAGDV